MPSYDKVEQASEHDTTTSELDHIKDGITQKDFEWKYVNKISGETIWWLCWEYL